MITFLVGVNGIRWLKSIELKGNDHIQLVNYIHSIEFLNSEIRQIEKQISIEASNNENIKILMMSMTGIDYFSAMLISSEIGEISRFSTAGKLVSWCGMCPTVHQSGTSMYMGRMKKDGNKKKDKLDYDSSSKYSIKNRRKNEEILYEYSQKTWTPCSNNTCSKQDDKDNLVYANIQTTVQRKKEKRNYMRQNLRGSKSNVR